MALRFAPEIKDYSGQDGLDAIVADEQIDGVVVVLAVQSMLKVLKLFIMNVTH